VIGQPLVVRVAAALDAYRVPYALIGAAALAAHGVARSTFDLDLLTTAANALEPGLWRDLSAHGSIRLTVRKGDPDDPLLGLVRIEADGQRAVDVVVGRWAWQSAAVARAKPIAVGGVPIPVVGAADLVLLKLYAGGSQDCWDIEPLLADADTPAIVAEVDSRVAALPARAAELWQRLRAPTSSARVRPPRR
jgi:hypothetical protein